MRATRTAVAQSAPETGEELLARILTERRKAWQGRGDYKEPAPPKTADLPSLPDGWRWTRLEQLGFIFGGLTKNPKRARLPKQLPYLRVANVYANELRLQEIEHIGVQDSELAKLLVRAGDLLIVEGNGSKDHIGRLAIWDGSIALCVHQNHLIKVRPVETGMPKWMLHWLQSPGGRHFVELVASSTSGLYTLSVNKVGDLPIPLASLPEQRRIVAEIEKQFTRLEAGVAALRRVQANLKRYRAAILKAACEGRLVPTKAKDWKDGSLRDVLVGIEAGKSFRCEERPPTASEIGVVKVSAVTWGTYDELESKTCLDPDRVEERYLVSPNDFLFSRANTIELIGACVIAQKVTLRVMLSDKILRFHLSAAVNPKWVLYWLRSDFGRSEIERLATGNQDSMRNIGQERIRQIAMKLPPLAEQTRIVAEVERRLSVVEELEAVVSANLARSLRLRQSILQKAFTGQLV